MRKCLILAAAGISIALLILAGCSGGPGESELERLVTESLSKKIPNQLAGFKYAYAATGGTVAEFQILGRGEPLKIGAGTQTPYKVRFIGTFCAESRGGKCKKTLPYQKNEIGVWLSDDGKGNLSIDWIHSMNMKKYFRCFYRS